MEPIGEVKWCNEQIVENFDPRLRELALEGPDITEKSKNDEMF